MKKLLFFDIDGTLVDFGNSTMSPSTADALINAKQNGHMIFLTPMLKAPSTAIATTTLMI